MLSIGLMSSGSAAYYLDLAREDYYLEGGEPLGRWHGRAAKTLSLSGNVQKEHLRNLFAGFTEDGKKALVQIQKYGDGRSRQTGWDLTFSAPKSVSVLWALSDSSTKEALQKAHAKAVGEALSYLEEEAAYSRRGKGGASVEEAKLVFATFEHGTSRAQDPQLHTHALLLNLSERQDGSFGTVRSRDVYQHKMLLGGLYRTALAHELRGLGLALTKGETSFELKDVDKSLCERFSKRRAAIEEAISEIGYSNARVNEKLALSTRSRKQHVARGELVELWKEEALGHRLPSINLNKQQAPDRARKLSPRIPRAIVAETLAGLERSCHHFTERKILQKAVGQLEHRGFDPKKLMAALKQEVRQQTHKLGQDGPYSILTTEKLLRHEVGLLQAAKELNEADGFAVPQAVRVRTAEQHEGFSEDQLLAFRHLTDEKRLGLVAGLAGTGKTTLLDACHHAWKDSGYKVIGASLSGKAALQLESGSGIKSTTIASLRYALNPSEVQPFKHGFRELWRFMRAKNPPKRARLTKKTILVIDEAGMAPSTDVASLLNSARKAGSKVVLVGDWRQLPAVQGVSPFKAMFDCFGGSTLSTVFRQKAEWMRDALSLIASGAVREGLSLFADKGRIHLGGSAKESVFTLIDAWDKDRTRNLKETLILASTNAAADKLNELAQNRRLFRKEIDKKHFVRVGKKRFHLKDRVLITANDKRAGVANGDLGTITKIQSRGLLAPLVTVQLDRSGKRWLERTGKRVTFPLDAKTAIRHGYAITTHRSQGSTVDKAFVLGEKVGAELLYVQLSRARKDTRIFLADGIAGEDMSEYVRSVEQQNREKLALERELELKQSHGMERGLS